MLVSQILKSKSDDGVVTMPPGTAISRVAEVLSARRFGAVVISSDGKKMDGIVSERDIVREIGRRGGAFSPYSGARGGRIGWPDFHRRRG
jgi:CBS domain-containing protein